jgi:hypothetical protein
MLLHNLQQYLIVVFRFFISLNKKFKSRSKSTKVTKTEARCQQRCIETTAMIIIVILCARVYLKKKLAANKRHRAYQYRKFSTKIRNVRTYEKIMNLSFGLSKHTAGKNIKHN